MSIGASDVCGAMLKYVRSLEASEDERGRCCHLLAVSHAALKLNNSLTGNG